MGKLAYLKVVMTMTIIMSIVATQTACPKENEFDKAAKTSLRIAQLTRDAVEATARAYNDGIISLETKDKMAMQLDRVIAGGRTFNAAVSVAYEKYKKTGDLSSKHTLDILLTNEVVTPFLQFLELAKVVSPEQAPYLWTAINVLRTALLAIGSLLGENTQRMLGEDYYEYRRDLKAYQPNGMVRFTVAQTSS